MGLDEIVELRKLLETPQPSEESTSFGENARLLGLGLIWGCVLGVIVFFLRYGPGLISTRACP